MDHPSPSRLHIVSTARDPATGLALSSRNAYLTSEELIYAPTLYSALQAAAGAWAGGARKVDCLSRALGLLSERAIAANNDHCIEIKPDYIEMNDPETLEVVADETRCGVDSTVILSGAVWVGRTRLIDNFILGDAVFLLN